MFNHIKEAVNWLENQTKFKPKTDLDRMRSAYELLDLDFKGKKLIHVAGTNGKGSVCSYLTEICLKKGLSVGTYTSPYLITFNERIRLDGHIINDELLLDSINQIYDFNQKFSQTYGEHLAFFELLTLMTLLIFSKQEVDVLIMEVGLGGLLDATNVLSYDLSIITNIGFDHMKQLGNTLDSIAANKLGILKKGSHLITTVDKSLHSYFISHMEDLEVSYQLISSESYELHSMNPINYTYRHETYQLALLGKHQILNSILAIEAVLYLYPDTDKQIIKDGLKQALWAGRLEMIKEQVYIDGAHNNHALLALKESMCDTFKDKRVNVLFSALGDKDIKSMLDVIKDFANKIVLTSFEDFRFKDLSEYEDLNFKYIKDFDQAFKSLYDHLTVDEVLLITGSLHFAGFAKKHLV